LTRACPRYSSTNGTLVLPLKVNQLQGAIVEGPYLCPHRYKVPCPCRKPSGLLYRIAAADLGIDIARSFVIGDTRDDLEAARVLGCPGIVVRTGWQVDDAVASLAQHVADDLTAAAAWVTNGA
jgi:D-glycero-D-manno-heptose 1,7-bisphosphate phosphatase